MSLDRQPFVGYAGVMADGGDIKSFKGVVKGGGVVLEDGVSLPEGTPVVVTVQDTEIGSPQSVLAAVAAPPHVSAEDVTALLQAIENGKKPVRFESPLD